MVVLVGSSTERTKHLGRPPSLTSPPLLTPTVICSYLGGDLPRIRSSFLIGSVVPLLSLLVWDAIVLGFSADSGAADPFDLFMRYYLLNELCAPPAAVALPSSHETEKNHPTLAGATEGRVTRWR